MLQIKGFHFYEGGAKWIARGVAYGPFRPNSNGDPYPEAGRIREDFSAMAAAGINSVRLYELPEDTLAAIAAEYGLRLLIDVPWPKHLDVYDSAERQAMCFRMLEDRIGKLRNWPNVHGLLLGNEIPSDLVRWAGTKKVSQFLENLYNHAKELAPDLPIGYANYPSTEFLRLHFFDFIGFNVYLHDPEVFRRYLKRLRLLYPEKPLVLTEIGFDSQQHGRAEQARLLTRSIGAAFETGFSGAYIFSWTDEWHTGGFDISDWAFGIVDKDRKAKPALDAIALAYGSAPASESLSEWPAVSVVVATYNGNRTLRQCLESLINLHYPDYEIVVVDDGSTDNTASILEEFPQARVVTQPNMGLSAARNSGIQAAKGEIVAFTDSDCVVDPDWLHHLVISIERGGFAGIGGPNLTPPEKGAVTHAIALAPGHATHVLLNEHEAEHVPGCNMAFKREALLEIGGFNPIFRKAGDDVDVIWRLQDEGKSVGFSTGGFVWHHRRPTLKAYLRQQIGYGEAESLLLGKHPHRFNDRGQSIWRGVIYSNQETAAALGGPIVHYGVFGSAGFQCVYERPAGLLSYVIRSVEWWAFCAALLFLGVFWHSALQVGLIGATISLAAGGLKAWRKIQEEGSRKSLFPLVWLLWILQPLFRGGARYWFRYRTSSPSGFSSKLPVPQDIKPVLQYWSESGLDRLDVLRRIMKRLTDLRWIFLPNTGWEPWDLSIVSSWWFKILLTTAEENHGQNRRTLKLKFDLVPTSILKLSIVGGLFVCLAVFWNSTLWARIILTIFLVGGWMVYRQGRKSRLVIAAIIDDLLRSEGFLAQEAAEPPAMECLEAGTPGQSASKRKRTWKFHMRKSG